MVLVNGKDVKTVNGADVRIRVAEGSVEVAGAKVISADVMCDNGVIHVIDTVMLPTGTGTAVEAKSMSSSSPSTSQATSGKVLSAPRQAKWFPMLLSPPALDGALAGDVGFDPLGFSADSEVGNPFTSRHVLYIPNLYACLYPLRETVVGLYKRKDDQKYEKGRAQARPPCHARSSRMAHLGIVS